MTARVLVRELAALGAELTLAPERHLAARLGGERGGVTLESLVVVRNERLAPRDLPAAIVLDTTHAKDGVLDVHAARASASTASAKKRVREGDLLVSRLRPYLRQIALVHPSALSAGGVPMLACSTEFYVLAPHPGADLAFLVPFLLGPEPQAALAAGQEGGHHPRVPLETLLGLRVPPAVVAGRAAASRRVRAALAGVYAAARAYRRVLTE